MAEPVLEAKVLIVGDCKVGKSSLWARLTGSKFSYEYKSTIGIDFSIHNITRNGRQVKMRVWDTTGQKRFRSVVETYYKATQFVVVVYSVEDPQSFANAARWMSEVANIASHDLIERVLVANQTDLNPTASRVIVR